MAVGDWSFSAFRSSGGSWVDVVPLFPAVTSYPIFGVDTKPPVCNSNSMSSLIREHSRPNPGCFENNPTTQSVLFGDSFVNLRGIERVTSIAHASLSRIFSGSRKPTLDQALILSRCLGFSSVDEFMSRLRDHFQQIERKRLAKVKSTPTYIA